MAVQSRVGVYPGTFDPITVGHLDIIARSALHLVDRLIVAVATNAGKEPMFNVDERVELAQAGLETLPAPVRSRIDVQPFDNLLMHFVGDVGASLIVRGLRAVSDFEYEFQMAAMNRRLNSDVETVFLMALDRNQFISSRFVKEIGLLGGDVAQFLPGRVHDYVKRKLEQS
ncbi:MAG: pantetheine-phosphate adenylyltransferase [Rhodospirillales bacterium]|nr:MAG: pantetheine-phosphate adenylyltransferase [Rhodospirillales bacterium]